MARPDLDRDSWPPIEEYDGETAFVLREPASWLRPSLIALIGALMVMLAAATTGHGKDTGATGVLLLIAAITGALLLWVRRLRKIGAHVAFTPTQVVASRAVMTQLAWRDVAGWKFRHGDKGPVLALNPLPGTLRRSGPSVLVGLMRRVPLNIWAVDRRLQVVIALGLWATEPDHQPIIGTPAGRSDFWAWFDDELAKP